MPQYFLNIAGVEITDFNGQTVGFSGSHDATIALVNSGAYDVGVLNKQVWERNVKKNPTRVKTVSYTHMTLPTNREV